MRARKKICILLLAFCSILWVDVFGQGPGKAAYMSAERLRKGKRYAEAIAKYEEAEKLEPGNYRYLFSHGKCYAQMKNLDLAISTLQECVQYKEDFTPAYSLMAKLYRADKDYTNAVYYYEQAFNFESNPKRKVSYILEAVKLQMKQGKTAEAQASIGKAKSAAPEDLNILYYDAKLSNMNGDYENAKSSMLAIVPKIENTPPAQAARYYYELGYAQNRLNDYQGANKSWEKAYFGKYRPLIDRERKRNSPGFFYKKAISYYLAGHYSESEEQIRRAFELQADFSAGYKLMAIINQKQGNFTQAISNYNSAADMEKDPKKKLGLQMKVAKLQLSAGDYSGALNSSNSVLSSQPNNPRVLYIKAMSQYHLGQYSGSISTLEGLLSSASLDGKSKAKYNFALGMAAKNTDPERAKTAFKNAMYSSFKPAAKNELDKLLGKDKG